MNPSTSSAGTLARVLCNRVGKWVAVVLWVVALAVLAPLAGKLTGAQDNQAVSWLPGSAESTKVLQISERFRSSNEVPVIVVYEKSAGLSPADLAAIDRQATQFGGLAGWTARSSARSCRKGSSHRRPRR